MVEKLDLRGVSVAEANKLLQEMVGATRRVQIQNPNGRHSIAVNVVGEIEIEVDGSTGFYTCGFMNGPNMFVKGNVGWYAADNMIGGRLVVERNAGSNLAPSMIRGTVYVKGSAGSRVGYGLKGGVVIVGGDVGMLTGQQMMAGRIILLGRGETGTGESMYGGVIHYRKGAIAGMGTNVRERALDEEDLEALKAIFAENELDADPQEFVSLVPLPGKKKYKLFKPAHMADYRAQLRARRKELV